MDPFRIQINGNLQRMKLDTIRFTRPPTVRISLYLVINILIKFHGNKNRKPKK